MSTDQPTGLTGFTAATLRHRHAIWALGIAIAAFGTVAYLRMPVQLFPDTAPPIVNVVTVWPGASAEDVETGLVEPLERAFAAVEGVRSLRSTAQDNLGRVTLEFRYGRQTAIAAVEVSNAIARIRSELPPDIREPMVLTFSPADRPVVTLGVRAASAIQARRLADDVLAPRLQRLAGVSAVDVYGGGLEAIHVDLDPQRLAAAGLTVERVAQTLRAANLSAPAGEVQGDIARATLRLDARAADPAALAALPLPTASGRLPLGTVATITRSPVADDAAFAIDGERAIALAVHAARDAHAVEVVAAVMAEVERLRGELPGVTLVVGEESGSFATRSIDTLLGNVWQALALAAGLLWLFLGSLRAALVVSLSMPLAYAMTFAAMRLAGISFDMVTLTAIILGVGMVVDAAVVVLENIERRRQEEGLSAAVAAVVATDEVRLSVLAGVGTTVVVLVPLMTLDGFIGRTFGPLALTLLLAFVSSAAVALVLLPTLSLWLGGDSAIDRAGMALTRPFRAAVEAAAEAWLVVLRLALRARLLTLALALGLLVLGLAQIRAQGMGVLPKMDGGAFTVALETSPGSSLAETWRVVHEVSAVVRAQPEVVRVQAQAGWEAGMKAAVATGAEGPTQGLLSVTLSDRTARAASVWEVEARVRAAIAKIPGVSAVAVREQGNTAKPTTTAPIVVQLRADDPLVLDRLGDDVLARLRPIAGVVEPLRSWRWQQPRQVLHVDRERAAALGIAPAQVARTVAAATRGLPAGSLRLADGVDLPVLARLDPATLPDGAGVLDVPIASAAGPSVPLRSVAALGREVGPDVRSRDAQRRTLEISAFLEGRALSFVLSDVEAALRDLPLPAGAGVEVIGERRDLDEARGSLLGALAVAAVAVYLLLVAQLGSFVHPLTILVSAPLSLGGVGLGLRLMDKTVSMPVMVGLVLLVGTVVNNAIILVDFIGQRRAAGGSRAEALRDAVRTRFRPIWMTSASTIVGMIPLAGEWALGAERFSPLAIAVIGGMLVSTLLTLIVIPVLYDLSESAGEALRRWRGGGAAALPKVASAAIAPGGVGMLAVVVAAAALAVARPAVAAPPLTLAAAQQQAAQHSPALQGARRGVEAAAARVRSADARRLPTVDVLGRASRQSEVPVPQVQVPLSLPGLPPPKPIQLGEQVVHVAALQVVVEQPLYAGGAIDAGRGAARHGEELRRAQLAKVRADLDLDVARAFWELARLVAQRDAAAAAVAQTTRRQQLVQALAEAGRARPVDVLDAAAAQAEAEARRLRLDAGVQGALATLQGLLGAPVAIEALDLTLPAPQSPGTGDAAPATATPEQQLAQAQAALRRAEASATGATRLPRLALRAGWTLANPNPRYFPVENAWHDTWEVSLVGSWRAWDRGASAAHAAATAEADAAADDARQASERLHAMAAAAAARLAGLVRAEAQAEAQIAARRAALAATEAERAAGRQTEAAVGAAALAVLQAELQRIELRADAALALAQWRRAGGGGATAAGVAASAETGR